MVFNIAYILPPFLGVLGGVFKMVWKISFSTYFKHLKSEKGTRIVD